MQKGEELNSIMAIGGKDFLLRSVVHHESVNLWLKVLLLLL